MYWACTNWSRGILYITPAVENSKMKIIGNNQIPGNGGLCYHMCVVIICRGQHKIWSKAVETTFSLSICFYSCSITHHTTCLISKVPSDFQHTKTHRVSKIEDTTQKNILLFLNYFFPFTLLIHHCNYQSLHYS